MSAEDLSIADTPETETRFQWGNIFTIVGGHFIHDTYSAFVAPLLPLIIEKLSISLTMAGGLSAIMQFPSVLNPFIGYIADRVNMRGFVIFAPAVTASLIGIMGYAPNYGTLAFLFFLIGLSSASFHAPAPPMVATISGGHVGRGMSLFMAAGELGRTLGPIIAVSAVAAWGLEDLTRLIVIGWASSLIMFWRFRGGTVENQSSQTPSSVRAILPTMLTFFLPIFFVVLGRSFLAVSVTTFLPTFLTNEGATLAEGGIMLAILEGGGVLGAITSGTISDKISRKTTLILAFILSSVFSVLFLQINSWWSIPVIFLLGFFSLAPGPVLLALVQDHYPKNRAVANGLYMAISFVVRSLALLLIGLAGDTWNLRVTFYGSALISLIAIPAIIVLSTKNKTFETIVQG